MDDSLFSDSSPSSPSSPPPSPVSSPSLPPQDDIPEVAILPSFDDEEDEEEEQPGMRKMMAPTSALSSPLRFDDDDEEDEQDQRRMAPTSALSSPIDFDDDEEEEEQVPGISSSIAQRFSQSSQSQTFRRPSTPPPLSPPRPPAAPSTANTLQTMISESESNFIWGTNINIEEATDMFREFITTFRGGEGGQGGQRGQGGPIYLEMLERLARIQGACLNVDARHLRSAFPQLYDQLVAYPQEIIPQMDAVVTEIYASFADEEGEMLPIQVRTFNLARIDAMRDLSPGDIDRLVCIRGMIIRTSPIIPDLKQAYFECHICHAPAVVTIDRGRIEEPTKCQACRTKDTLSIIHNRCLFADRQMVKLQEVPDSIPEGETPQSVCLFAYDDLVDYPKPGDRVVVTGIYRANPVRTSSTRRTVQAIYKTYIDVIHYKLEETGDLFSSPGLDDGEEGLGEEAGWGSGEEDEEGGGEGNEESEKAKALKEKLWKIAKSENVSKILLDSFAPSVWELEDVKKGILCMLFGGTRKKFAEAGLGNFRGEINLLLVGDPGTSKSQLLQYTHKLAPRGIYTSGKGSSAVGLTAYITKDPDTKQAVLESGALVLSDRGICCIDEFDKMSDHTRTILHEAMEQQTVSVAKAGIICTLNARTSILASANPRQSRYNPRMSVVDNIMLPPTLLSRFDLIYLVLDNPNPATDRTLAKHLISLYYRDPDPRTLAKIDRETLRAFIAYARKHIHPTIPDEVKEDFVEGYLKMRKMGGGKKTVSATPRQLESIIRLSEALAKMRFSQVVTRSDCQEALRLMRVALQQAAMDPTTGTIDMDLISTGRSATSRGRLSQLVSSLRNTLSDVQNIQMMDLLRQINEDQEPPVSTTELRDAVLQLQEDGTVSMSGDPRNPRIRCIAA